MRLKLTVVVDYIERSTHPKDLEKLLLQAVPRAKEEGWLTTLHDARVKEISCKVDVLPEQLVGEWEPPTPIAVSSFGERDMPWCEACGSYHIEPRSRGEWLMLRCFAPFDGERSTFGRGRAL